jgi:hypothetical protein
MTTAPHVSPVADMPADGAHDPVAGPGRIRLVAGALAAAAASVAVLVALHPWGERLDSGADEILSYDVLLRADRDTAWASLLVDGFAFAVVALTAALGTCLLVRRRGRLPALVGSVLTVTGGVLFAMGSSGFATLTWYATSDALPEAAARGLVTYANDTPAQLLGAQMAGFLLVTVGGLTLAVALGRARAVPLPAVAGFVVLTLALFVPLPAGGIDVVQVLQMALVAALAIPLWRRAAV